MKDLFVIFFVVFSSSVLCAQEAVEYDTALIESVTGTDSEDEDYDDDDDDSETEHLLVDPDEVVKKTEYDDEKINIKKFDSKEWKKVVGSTDYQEKPEEPQKPATGSGINIPWANPVLKVIAYAIILAIVVAVLYFVAKNIKIDQLVDKRALTADDPMSHVEHIEELDVNQLLQKALAEGNFKLVVRLYFLRLLKKLNEGEVIAWKKDKTNRDYLSEIFARNFYFNELRQLTLAYEQIWYGEHVIPDESYKELFTEFEAIQQKINIPKA